MVDGNVCDHLADTSHTSSCETQISRVRPDPGVKDSYWHIPDEDWRAQGDIRSGSNFHPRENSRMMGLLKGTPKAGFSNKNDSNPRRRFFDDPRTVPKITDIDLLLLRNFRLILEILSSGRGIHVDEFSIPCVGTAERYLR